MDTTFIDELASAAPTPGGGGAASYVGAVASALASMVGNLTVGKKTYAAVEDDVRATLERLALLRNKLLALIESDAQAFEPLAASYRMPKATPEEAAAKQAALQLALGPACDVPLIIMRTCAEVIDHADFLARNGSKLAVSDAGAAAVLARAAVVAASMNVYINAASMDDERARSLSRRSRSAHRRGERAPTEFSPTPWTRYGNIASFTTRTRKADMAELPKGKPVVDDGARSTRASRRQRAKVVPASRSCAWASVPTTCPTNARPVNVPNRSASPSGRTSWTSSPPSGHRGGNPRGEPRRKRARLPVVPAAAVVVDESHVCELLDPKKDIDGITLASLASVSPTATGIPARDGGRAFSCSIITRCRSRASTSWWWTQPRRGKPVSTMLLRCNASVTICHSKTENLADIMRSADVVICATGRARTFGAQFFGPGQTVLDVGINFDTQGNLCGDVDFAEVEPVVAAITPVPGGIGTVTTSVTMAHTVAAAEAALAARTGRR
ncbi:MAG: cyclodeaminase/cyclohydrolase family protein [Eggerthella lenta]